MIITMQTAVAAWAIQKGPEMPAWLDICWGSTLEREKREKKNYYSIQPALAYGDASWLESLAKLRTAARQSMADSLWFLCLDNPLFNLLVYQ